MRIERCHSVEQPGWLTLRESLWPDQPRAEHEVDVTSALATNKTCASFVAYQADRPVGLVEVTIRGDYVNGTDSTPIGFLEGVYVLPDCRLQGIARALVASAETWAAERGCSEFASDAPLENLPGHAMHESLGFEETERVVYFRKLLSRADA